MMSKKQVIFSVLSLIIIIGTICAVSASDDINLFNTNCTSNGTFHCPDQYDNFDFSLRYVPTSGYHWVLDENASYGVQLIGNYLVLDNPDPAYSGSPGTMHFIFHFTSKDHQGFVKMNLVSPNGEVEQTVTSDMVN